MIHRLEAGRGDLISSLKRKEETICDWDRTIEVAQARVKVFQAKLERYELAITTVANVLKLLNLESSGRKYYLTPFLWEEICMSIVQEIPKVGAEAGLAITCRNDIFDVREALVT